MFYSYEMSPLGNFENMEGGGEAVWVFCVTVMNRGESDVDGKKSTIHRDLWSGMTHCGMSRQTANGLK